MSPAGGARAPLAYDGHAMAGSFWIETLGCPKNQVDSDKLVGHACWPTAWCRPTAPDGADVVVVNTCAFVEEARQESIDTILALDGSRAPGARLVVTGCMAERYGDELADALPEVDSVAGFGVPVSLTAKPTKGAELVPSLDLLNLPRPASTAPWAYVKVAEGCDRACGFCAIPSFRGKQRSRTVGDILDEVDALEAREIVLVAQDLAAFGRDQGVGERAIVPLVRRRGRARRAGAPALPLPVRSHRPVDRRHLRQRRARTSTSRSSTCRPRCCAA